MKRICNYLADRDHNVVLVCRFSGGVPQHEFSDSIKFFDLSSERLLRKFKEINAIIRSVKPDYIHLHYLARDIIIPALKFRRKYKYIVTIWGSDLNILSKKPVNRILQNIGLVRAHRIHLLSGYFNETVLSKYILIKHSKISVFSWGIDLQKLKHPDTTSIRKVKDKFGLGNNKIILSFRNHRPLYNHHTLLRAIPHVVTAFPDSLFVFVTGYTDKDYLDQSKQIVAESNVSDHVLFIEQWLDDEELAALINMAHVSVNIPLADGLPASLLEIMSSKAVPAAGDLPAYKGFFRENINGLMLHDLTNSVELQGLLIRALNNMEQLAEEFSMINNKYVKEFHDWEIQSEKLSELYNN